MRKAAFIAFTEKGCRLAVKLAHELEAQNWSISVDGPERFCKAYAIGAYEDIDAWTGEHFAEDDALVFVGAAGIAVRAIAPYVKDKFADPAVVQVDEAGSFVVPLLSGHVGGANDLARELATCCAAQAVVSTATDVNGLFAVDEWARKQGLVICERVIAREVSAALLEGSPVGFASDFDISGILPKGLQAARLESRGPAAGPAPAQREIPPLASFGSSVEMTRRPDVPVGQDTSVELGIHVTYDETSRPFARTLHLVPKNIVIGAGCRKQTDSVHFAKQIYDVLEEARVSPKAVKALASIDIKALEQAILDYAEELGCELRFYTADELSSVQGAFSTSEFVENTVGVDNVCERSAVLASNNGTLVCRKQARDGVTVALAQERMNMSFDQRQKAKLSVVGLGPGGADSMTLRAHRAIEESDLIVGYTVYIDLLKDEFPNKETLTTPMRKEVERCRMALEQAACGRTVAMVCSGDPGVYGMAGLIYELSGEFPNVDIEVVPGVSAANGGASVLGAALMHDFAVISLSDLLTPWESIETRLRAAGEADFCICLYNPSSHKRFDYLQRACDILLEVKDPATVCGFVRNIGREGEKRTVTTLGKLRDTPVDMFTIVFIGNSQTKVIDGHMVTPRGYLTRED